MWERSKKQAWTTTGETRPLRSRTDHIHIVRGVCQWGKIVQRDVEEAPVKKAQASGFNQEGLKEPELSTHGGRTDIDVCASRVAISPIRLRAYERSWHTQSPSHAPHTQVRRPKLRSSPWYNACHCASVLVFLLECETEKSN